MPEPSAPIGAGSANPAVADAPESPAPAPPADRQRAQRQVEQTLATFARAIEQKDLALYRSVRPGLSADEERRLEAGFAAVESQLVDLEISSIDITDDRATVRVSRRDVIQIGGGEQTQTSMQTMTLRRAEGGWMIEEIES